MTSSRIALALLWTATAAAPAQTTSTCNTYGFVLYPERSIEVRAGAGEHFDLVDVVQPDEDQTLFSIIGIGGTEFDGYWLKVDTAIDSRNQQVFSGTGWVQANALAVKSHPAYAVYADPSTHAKRVDISLFEAVLPLAGCRGEWVHVELPVTGTEIPDPVLRGWMPPGAYCANPWLACD